MKNFILGLLAAVILIAGGYFSYLYGKNSAPKPSANPVSPPVSPTGQLVGNDRDDHGCIGSAGYSWCASKNKCLRVWEEGCPSADDARLITEALITKNNWKPGYVSVTLRTNDGRYASGSVPGGYVFAAKVNGNWEIVADGNGNILCSSLEKYPDYPNTLIPECYNQATDKNVTR